MSADDRQHRRKRSSEKDAAVARERARLLRDLHDGLAQDLWFMNLQVKLLQDAVRARRQAQANELVAELRQALEWGFIEVRSLMAELQRPPEPVDLATELARLTEQFPKRGGATVELNVDLRDPAKLDAPIVTQLVRFTREALANVAKHATATRVVVRVAADDHEVRMLITDNGRGFDPVQRVDGHHLGLRSMRARIASLGGRIVIWSAPGRGTTLYFSAPLSLDQAQSDPALRLDSPTDTGWAQEESPGALAAG